jgi:hypothetical protein
MPDLPPAKRLRASDSRTGTAKSEANALGTELRTSTVVSLWVIGVLVMLNIMLRFPELGALIERYNQY